MNLHTILSGSGVDYDPDHFRLDSSTGWVFHSDDAGGVTFTLDETLTTGFGGSASRQGTATYSDERTAAWALDEAAKIYKGSTDIRQCRAAYPGEHGGEWLGYGFIKLDTGEIVFARDPRVALMPGEGYAGEGIGFGMNSWSSNVVVLPDGSTQLYEAPGGWYAVGGILATIDANTWHLSQTDYNMKGEVTAHANIPQPGLHPPPAPNFIKEPDWGRPTRSWAIWIP